jgi:hypothetical protein
MPPGPQPQFVHDVGGEAIDGDRRDGERLHMGFETAHDEELFDQAAEPVALPVGRFKERIPLIWGKVRGELPQRLDVALDRRERGTQFMRDHRHEVVLHPVQVGHVR